MSDPIDLLLTESELEHDTVLRDLLGEIEHEATAVRPMPSSELSALMYPQSAAARRPRRRSFAGRGAVITSVVVIGTLGLGATAAAASPEARSAIGAGVAAIAHLFQPALGAPEPAPTSGHPASGTSDVPSTGPSADASDGPSADPTADPTGGPSPSADATAGADDRSGSSGKSGDSHGNGTGNQSGRGNGKGQGNGGPAPTP